MIVLQLDVKPVPKGRPRFTKSGHAFTPQRTKDFEQTLKVQATELMIEHKLAPIEGAIFATMVFGFACPKSASKKRRAELLAGYHTSRPDLDNLMKMIDAFNGIIWKDDSQIMSMTASKCYAEEDFVLFVFHTEEDFDEETDFSDPDFIRSLVRH